MTDNLPPIKLEKMAVEDFRKLWGASSAELKVSGSIEERVMNHDKVAAIRLDGNGEENAYSTDSNCPLNLSVRDCEIGDSVQIIGLIAKRSIETVYYFYNRSKGSAFYFKEK
jgi:hypothetical protein